MSDGQHFVVKDGTIQPLGLGNRLWRYRGREDFQQGIRTGLDQLRKLIGLHLAVDRGGEDNVDLFFGQSGSISRGQTVRNSTHHEIKGKLSGCIRANLRGALDPWIAISETGLNPIIVSQCHWHIRREGTIRPNHPPLHFHALKQQGLHRFGIRRHGISTHIRYLRTDRQIPGNDAAHGHLHGDQGHATTRLNLDVGRLVAVFQAE